MRNDPATATPPTGAVAPAGAPAVAPVGDPPGPGSTAGDHTGLDDPDLVAATARAAPDEHRVAVLLLPGINPFEFSIACEVFGIRRGEVLATMARPRWYDLRVCAPSPGTAMPSRLGFSMTAEHGLEELARADTVVVPSSPHDPHNEHVAPRWRRPLPPDPQVVDAVRAAAERGARMVSFCSGAFVLGEAGVLDGRRATTHWMYLAAFRDRFPRVEVVPDVLYVDEGQVLTSAGSAAGLDLALHLVRRDHGVRAADLVARRTVVPPHRDGGQAQYVVVPEVRSGGTPFSELLEWVLAHLHEPLTVADLADRAAMSERTFARRFVEATGSTPHQWLTARRVDRARELLETTDLTVDAVATHSGLGSAANLRQRLREALGVSPSAYRRRFDRTG